MFEVAGVCWKHELILIQANGVICVVKCRKSPWTLVADCWAWLRNDSWPTIVTAGSSCVTDRGRDEKKVPRIFRDN